MTTSATDSSTTTREEAWQIALQLYSRMERDRLNASSAGGGWTDRFAVDRVKRSRTELDALIAAHGFEGTRVDPLGMTWVEEQGAPWELPPADCDRISCKCHGHVMGGAR